MLDACERETIHLKAAHGHHLECPQKTMANMVMMTNQLSALELASKADKTLMMFLPSFDVND